MPVIEKQTGYRQEHEMATKMLAAQPAGAKKARSSVFPYLYGADTTQGPEGPVHRIFMEYLPAPIDAPITSELLNKLVVSSVKLQTALSQILAKTTLTSETTSLRPNDLAILEAALSPNDKEILENLLSIQQSLEDLPLICTHGDIYWHNIRLRIPGDFNTLKFHDFAWVSYLPAGAEWHHFASAAQRSNEEMERFRAITSLYASRLHLDPRQVRASASLHALRIALICNPAVPTEPPLPQEVAPAVRHHAKALCRKAMDALAERSCGP
ncbi:hypothetical protein [Cyanobium sp. NIES-981]|uniref:hypothetical protein n=1 Tax=Cyanobium sp. NIES-981 TaxID=1851505 RepID=UPI0012F89D25|nr:hypothetical protein [Cyanobium sp. NIES-981]